MSLLNEALKKAQRQRNEPTPFAGAGAARPVAPSRPVLPLTLLIVIGSGLLAIGGMLVVFLWPEKAPQATRSAPVVAAVPPATSVGPAMGAKPVGSLPATTTVSSAGPTVTFPAPAGATTASPAVITPAPAPAVASVTSVPVSPIKSTTGNVAATPSPPATANLAAPVVTATTASSVAQPVLVAVPTPDTLAKPRADPRVNAFLDALRVPGILASASAPRVLLNNQVFKPGDIVDRTLNLRLTQITAHTLTFTDASGCEYEKNF